jgi:hypothetical protein
LESRGEAKREVLSASQTDSEAEVNRKTLIIAAFAVLAHWLSAYAQGARWVDLQPVRSDAIGGSLGDIDSHLPAGHQYRDADKVTWGHETCHGIAARLRNENRADNGLYALGNRGFIFPSPRLTLREVAAAVPLAKRGRIYNLYMVQAARDWNDTVFYCADEMVAYVHGSRVGLELGMRERSTYSFQNALEMWGYVRTAQRMSRERGYQYQADLDKFIDEFHRDHIHWLLCEYKKRGWR